VAEPGPEKAFLITDGQIITDQTDPESGRHWSIHPRHERHNCTTPLASVEIIFEDVCSLFSLFPPV